MRVQAQLTSLLAGLGLLIMVCVSSAHGQAQPTGADSRPAPALRPEETAARKLLESGKPREALVELDRAAAAYRRAGDRAGLTRVTLRRSDTWRALGELDKAALDADAARAHAAGDSALLLQALTQIARVAAQRSDDDRADRALREALPIAERLGDAAGEATVLRMFVALEDRRGQNHAALEHSLRAARAADRSADATLRVRARAGAATALLALSRYDAALATAQEAFDIAEGSGVAALRADALFALAQAHAHVWNLDRAAELWTATIDAGRAAGNLRQAALAMKQRVESWFALGDFERAVTDGEQAVELLLQSSQAGYVAETMARLALSEVRRGRGSEARVWADRARARLPGTPESRHLFIHNDLGIVEAELGALDTARADFTRVLDVAREVGNLEYEWRAHWGFGRTALREQPAASVPALELAIASVDRLRQTIPEAGLRAAFMINRVGPYESLVEAHMSSASSPTDDKVRLALEVAERARGRALADLLAEARARLSDPRLAALRDEEVAFGARFSAVQKVLAGALQPPARAVALQQLHDLEREYEALVLRIRRDNPAYASLTHPRALSAAEIASIVGPDEALVEFLITEEKGFAWVVRRDTIRGYQVPGRKILDPQIRLLPALLSAGDDRALQQLGARLYSQLLAPAEAVLSDARRLIIVPDGVLQRLPFALLRSGNRWLIETQAVVSAPSATILQFLRQSQRARAPEPLLALAVAEPTPGQAAFFDGGARPLGVLAHAADEVATARHLVGAGPDSMRVGPAATEHALKSADASRYRILHLAAHAVADEIVPRRSAVLLTPSGEDDGLLQVSEVANLTLNADLVVLAACRSHVGRLVRGEGLLSLSRAFLHAGARAVVATAWTVPDRETTWLMERFYTGLRDGLPPDEALRQAQLAALASGGSRAAPGAWAAFVVFGEARTPILDPPDPSRWWTLALLTGTFAALGLATVLQRLRRHRLRAHSPHTEARGR